MGPEPTNTADVAQRKTKEVFNWTSKISTGNRFLWFGTVDFFMGLFVIYTPLYRKWKDNNTAMLRGAALYFSNIFFDRRRVEDY